MRRIVIAALACVLSVLSVTPMASAAGATLYVAGEDTSIHGDGSQANPYRGLPAAMAAAAAGDTLVLTENVMHRESGAGDGFTFTKAVTVQGGAHTLTFRGTDVFFDAPVTFDSLTLNVIGDSGQADLWAQGHDLTFKNVNTKIGTNTGQDSQRPTIYTGGKTAADNTGTGAAITIDGGDSQNRFAKIVVGDSAGGTLPATVKVLAGFAAVDQGIVSTTSGAVSIESHSKNVKTFTGNYDNPNETVIFDGVTLFPWAIAGIDNLTVRNGASVTTPDAGQGVPLAAVPGTLNVEAGASLTIGESGKVTVGTLTGSGTVTLDAENTLNVATVSGPVKVEARAWNQAEKNELLNREFFTAQTVNVTPTVVVTQGGDETEIKRNDEGKWIGTDTGDPEVTPIDTTDLKAQIDSAEKALADTVEATAADQVEQGKKWATKEQRATLTQVLNTAKAQLKNPVSEQDVWDATDNLELAIMNYNKALQDGTKQPSPAVDDSKLREAIQAGREALADAVISVDGTDVPTNKTWTTQAKADAFKKILDTAEQLANQGGLTSDIIDVLRQSVNNAGVAFVKSQQPGTKTDKPTPVDTSKLEEVILAGRQSLEDAIISVDGTDVAKTKTWTTKEKADAFKEILDQAQAAVDTGNLNAEEVETMRKMVVVAGTNFVKSQQPGTKTDKPTPVDTSKLEEVILAGRQSLEDAIISVDGTDVAKTKTWTTKEKADAFKQILDQAQAAVDTGNLSADEVEAMRKMVALAGTNFVKGQQPGTKSDKPVDPTPGTPTMINDLVAPTSNVDADATDPASCKVKPFVVITEREGVAYTLTVDGKSVSVVFADGVMRYEYPYGSTATVTATAKDGYTFADDATTEWSWTAPTRDSLKCDSPGGDTPQQPQADTPQAQEVHAKPTGLPRTGSNTAGIAMFALVVLVAGGVAVRYKTR